jgi:hypothetical protein
MPHLDQHLLKYSPICELQQQDKQRLALQVKYPNNFINLQLDEGVNEIICYKKDPAQPNWKIALQAMLVDTIKWFHQVMGHPSEKRLCEMLNQCYHHPKLHYHMIDLSVKIVKSTN